jgi:hypothetical protein
MNTALTPPRWVLLWSLTVGVAAAQGTPPPPAAAASAAPVTGAPAGTPTGSPAKASSKSAQIDAGEPRATMSAAPPAASPTAAESGGAGPARGSSRVAPSGRPAAAAGQSPAAGQKTPRADRLDLGTATVTGDREQPKVMYIVPWKKSDIGDQSGKPMNSLLDEALAPVDRDEFKREVVYYDAVRADAPQNGASNAAAKQGEK